MANTVNTTVDITIRATEAAASIGSGRETVQLKHPIDISLTHASGTSSDQNDLVYSVRQAGSTGGQTVDLTGSLTSPVNGQSVNFVDITYLAFYNESTTSGESITIGGGSNPITTLWNASGDAIVVGPKGSFVWSSPVDGAAVTAGTGDILTLTAATGTPTYRLVIIGRSA